MPISQHGNDAGYALVDAIVAIFIATVLVGAIAAGIASVSRYSAKTLIQAENALAERNQAVLRGVEQRSGE